MQVSHIPLQLMLDISTYASTRRFFTIKNCKIVIVLAISTYAYMQGNRVVPSVLLGPNENLLCLPSPEYFKLYARVQSSFQTLSSMKTNSVLKDTNSLAFFTCHRTFFHVDTVPQIGYEIICIKVEESFKYIKVQKIQKKVSTALLKSDRR